MVVAQYEALRSAALGDALPPEARTGLLLFLRGGMCGWARAVATMCAPQLETDLRADEAATGLLSPIALRDLARFFQQRPHRDRSKKQFNA